MKLLRLVTIAALALSAACVNLASEREAREREQRIATLKADLDSQIGRMMAEQAVARWGIPNSQFNGPNVTVYEWGKEATVPGVYVGGWHLQMTFDNKSRGLADWKYREW